MSAKAKKKQAEPKDGWKDRLIEVKRMRASDILPHAGNPRRHPKGQLEPLRGLLNEVGKADVLRAYYSERNGGKLTFWDGHARRDLDNDQEWSVAIFDLTDAEADKLLLSFDPLSALAEYDKNAMDTLLREVSTGDAALTQMLSDLVAKTSEAAIRTLAAGSSTGSETAASSMPDGYRAFNLVLTTSQETTIREAVRESKTRNGSETTAEALYIVAREWLNAIGA